MIKVVTGRGGVRLKVKFITTRPSDKSAIQKIIFLCNMYGFYLLIMFTNFLLTQILEILMVNKLL